MKKIGLLIYDDSLTGGAEKIAKELANELSIDYDIHVISLFQEKENNSEKKNYKHFVVSNTTVSITKNIFKLSKRIKEYLLENEIEILLCITAGVNTIAIMATRGIKTKTVYCEHSNLENKTYGKKHIFRQYLGAKFMDKIVALTDRDRMNFINMMKVPENKVLSIPNWFVHHNLEDIEYKDISKKIISVGRLEKVKGYDLLIKVAKLVFDRHKDWKWDIYGDGKYKEEIQNQINSNNLQDVIELKGNVNNLRELYNDYSFLVMTSYYEGIPLVLLEAQEAKLPIVSFDCPTGPSEIVVNDKNGYLVKCYNIELMADKICDLIDDRKKRIEFSNFSQINIDKFDKYVIIKKWKKLIEGLSNEKR